MLILGNKKWLKNLLRTNIFDNLMILYISLKGTRGAMGRKLARLKPS